MCQELPYLRLFFVNRQIYAESSRIFYKHNDFNFISLETTESSAATCLAFLYDRPQHVIQQIREISLSIGYDDRFSCSVFCRWKTLCREICTYMSLQKLRLDNGHYYHAEGLYNRLKSNSSKCLTEGLVDVFKTKGLHRVLMTVYDHESTETAREMIPLLMSELMERGGEFRGPLSVELYNYDYHRLRCGKCTGRWGDGKEPIYGKTEVRLIDP